ncbi:type III secretion system needle length determinant [Nitratidesulfovibrio sp. SRB-5]|uniref:type III secretion system needle length determinant n=1 Tax=Nitratidesulfovibrio sp. SRB-5 TaxID=2872636 RepID=UPI001024C3A0|nr:type III secretion system needle length determinant [Nitratidesulfovibrio sp. SRB-5]MBZ2170605.1 type III secretion system needle length determinant [Nitratidesulfovibrio sp. SRB-5]RXF76478.1 type III secretion system needle length determinant [Desulfovibrio sp. DS-1]
MADFLKVDAGRLAEAAAAQAGAQGAAGRRDAPPQERDVDAFDRAMGDTRDGQPGSGVSGDRGDRDASGDRRVAGRNQDDRRNSEQGGKGGDDIDQMDDGVSASPFQLLGGAMEGMLRRVGPDGADGAQAAAQASAPADPADMDGLTSSLVERILVSTPESGGNEVRILLGDALPGTEIRMTRGPDGMLMVDLATDDANSFQTLVAARAELKARLDQLEKGGVRVEVTDNARQDDGNADRRSAGYMDYDPDNQRGRRG